MVMQYKMMMSNPKQCLRQQILARVKSLGGVPSFNTLLFLQLYIERQWGEKKFHIHH